MLSHSLKVLVAILCFLAESALASVLDLKNSDDNVWLGPHFYFFQQDQGDVLGFFESNKDSFKIDQSVPSFGYTDKKYWAKVLIKNPSDISSQYVVIFKGPFEKVELFQQNQSGDFTTRSTGMYSPQANNVDYRYPAFQITLTPGLNSLLFTQDAVSPHYPALLVKPETFEKIRYREHIFVAFLYGISLVILVFAVFSMIDHPKGSVLYFTFSLITHLLFSLFVTGSARVFSLFVGESTGIDISWLEQVIYQNWIFWWGAAEFFSILFAWHFLELKDNCSRFIKVSIYLGLASSFCLAVVSYIDPVLSIRVFSPFYHVIVLIFAYISFRTYRKGFLPALNYSIAWMSYVASISVQAMYFFGFIGSSFLTSWGLLIGILFQYFFFGLAIIKKRKFVETNLKKQNDLEQKKVLNAKLQLEDNFQKLKKFDEALRVFVSPTIQLEVALGKNPLDYEARSVTRIVTFTDMRNYTNFSEKLELETAHGLLNACFKQIMDPVFEHQGEVDKLIGDAVMSVFKEKSAMNCLLSVLKGRENLSMQNKQLIEKGLLPIKFGTGISIGNVLSGNFGTMQKLDRTVLGDAVNIAARIESETKNYSVDVLASEAFIEQLASYEYSRPIDHILLRGKEKPITMHEIFGHNTEKIIDFKMSTKSRLHEVLMLKEAGNFEDCEKILLELIRRCPPHTYKADTIMDPTLSILLNIIRDKLQRKAG